MKVELSFNQVGTVCTSSVVENVDLDKVTQHLNDERRFVDLYEIERQYTTLFVRYFEKQSDGRDAEMLVAEIQNIDEMTQQQLHNELYEQFAEGVEGGWLDAEELGVLQLCIQPHLAKLKQ